MNNIVTLKSGLEVSQGDSKWQNGTIRKLGATAAIVASVVETTRRPGRSSSTTLRPP